MTTLAGKLIRSSILRVIDPLSIVAVSFFMMPYVIGHIGDRWYGLWILVATISGYFGFLDLGLQVTIQRFLSRAMGREDEDEANRVFNTSFFVFMLFGVITVLATAIVILASPQFIKNPANMHIFRVVMTLIGLNVAIQFPVRAFTGFLCAHIRFDVVNALDILKLVIRTALIVHFLSRGHGIIALAFITLCADTLQGLLAILFVKWRFAALPIKAALFTRSLVRPMFGYGIYVFVAQIANRFRFYLDAFIITAFLGLAMVTHYSIGARIITYYMTLVSSAITLIFPVFSMYDGKRDYDQLRDKFLFVVKLNTILSLFIGGSLLIYGKAFITRWMGPNYIDSYHVLAILLAGMIFSTIQIASTTLLGSISRLKVYAIVVTAEIAAKFALSLILVRPYGILGVAAGTTIPMFITNVFIVPIYANRMVDIPLWRYLRVVLGGILLGALVHVASWFIVRDHILSSYQRIIILSTATSVIFLAVNVFFMLSKRERGYFKIPI